MKSIKKMCIFCKRETYQFVREDKLQCNICSKITREINSDDLKEKAVIFDLDETLANTQHRLHYILQQNPKNWEAYNSKISEDQIYEWCKILISNFVRDGYKILFVTGRSESCRKDTLDWLLSNQIPSNFELHMRKDRDFRHDDIVKKEIYFENIEKKYNVLLAVDDRRRVVEMWRNIGLVCLQCKEGEY